MKGCVVITFVCLSGDGKEDYDAFEEVARMNGETVARELEEASNIKDLEAR